MVRIDWVTSNSCANVAVVWSAAFDLICQSLPLFGLLPFSARAVRDLLPQLLRPNRIYDGTRSLASSWLGVGGNEKRQVGWQISNLVYIFIRRIVRNKAAEKAKHVHHQQQSQNSGTPPGMTARLIKIEKFWHFLNSQDFFLNHLKWHQIRKTAMAAIVDQIRWTAPRVASAADTALTASLGSSIRTIRTWTRWKENESTTTVSGAVDH